MSFGNSVQSGPRSSQGIEAGFGERGVTVLGLDGVGRLIAVQLVMLGVPRLHLVDPRRVHAWRAVEEGFFLGDVGRWRAHATAQLCHEIRPLMCIQTGTDRKPSVRNLGRIVMVSGGPSMKALPGVRGPGTEFFLGVQVVVRGRTITVDRWDGWASPISLASRLHRSRVRERQGSSVCAPQVAAVAAGLAVRELGLPIGDRPARTRVRMDLATLAARIDEGFGA